MRDNSDKKANDPNIHSTPAQRAEPFDTQEYDVTINEQTDEVLEGTAATPKEVVQPVNDPYQ